MTHQRQSQTAQIHAVDRAMDEDVTRLSRRSDGASEAAPSPQQIRRLIRARQLRGRVFGQHLFADPAWDILLEAYASDLERETIPVSALCIASGVPERIALRWIAT